MRRQRGDVRHFLLRLQLAADGVRAARAAQGDHRHLRHRRPLHRRRALPGRHPQGARPGRLLPLHDPDERAAAGPGGVGRRVAGGVDPPGRDLRALGADLAAGAARRALLATRLRAPGLRADRLPDHDHRRLGRRLPQQLLPADGATSGSRCAAPAAGRTMGACRHRVGDPGTSHRLDAGDGRVVGPVAARHRERGRRRARGRPPVDDVLRALVDPPVAGARRVGRLLGARGVADAAGDLDEATARGTTAVRRPGRCRGRRMDRLRRAPTLGAERGPAVRRRCLERVGVGRRVAHADGSPDRSAPGLGGPAGGLHLAQAV